MLSSSDWTKNLSWENMTESLKTEKTISSSFSKIYWVYDNLESESSSGRTDINVELNSKNKYDYDTKASRYRTNNRSHLNLSSVTSSISS